MRSIVSPEQAKSEGSERSGTNHPWRILCLGKNDAVVDEKSAEGFPCARKRAPRLIDGTRVQKVAIAGGDRIPNKFKDDFKPVAIPGRGTLNCFLVTA